MFGLKNFVKDSTHQVNPNSFVSMIAATYQIPGKYILVNENWIHILEALTLCLVLLTVFRVAKRVRQSNERAGTANSTSIDAEAITVTEPEASKQGQIKHSPSATAPTKQNDKGHNSALNDYIGDFFSS